MSERRFFGERVQVACEKDAAGLHLPARFVLGEKAVEVTEVLRRWHDRGFHPQTRRRSWLERRHRTFYRVRATDGFVYDLYLDRTGGRRDWFVTRRTPSVREHDPSDADGSAPPGQ